MKGKPVDEISHNLSENSKEFNESPTEKPIIPKKKYLENNNKNKRILKSTFLPLKFWTFLYVSFCFQANDFYWRTHQKWSRCAINLLKTPNILLTEPTPLPRHTPRSHLKKNYQVIIIVVVVVVVVVADVITAFVVVSFTIPLVISLDLKKLVMLLYSIADM